MDCSLPGSFVHEDSPGKYAGVGWHAFLHGIFPTQGLNPGLPHCRQVLYHLSHQGSPYNCWLTNFPCCTFHICDSFICDSSFQVSVGHLYVFFGKTSIQILCPFFTTIGLFYIVWGFYVESYEFCILWLLIPCRYIIYKHLPFSRQSLHFVVDSFPSLFKSFLVWDSLIYFFFCRCCLRRHPFGEEPCIGRLFFTTEPPYSFHS